MNKHDGTHWIVINRWDGKEGFQHYKERDPVWIKNYTRLLSSDAYRDLTYVQRGVLHGLWLEYARSDRQLRDSTATISRRLGHRVTRATLDALNHAGFITFSASAALAQRKHDAIPEEETETEEETEKNQDQEPNPTQSITNYLPPELQPKKNGSGVDDGNNNGKDPQPIGETAAQLIAQLRGAA